MLERGEKRPMNPEEILVTDEEGRIIQEKTGRDLAEEAEVAEQLRQEQLKHDYNETLSAWVRAREAGNETETADAVKNMESLKSQIREFDPSFTGDEVEKEVDNEQRLAEIRAKLADMKMGADEERKAA